MEIDAAQFTATDDESRKRKHPDSATFTAQRTSLELLKLVETPNFEELSRRFPDFATAFRSVQQSQHVKGKKTFSSAVTPEFSISLTRGLLHAYFDLAMPNLPTDHLCPPVPNRFFYVHWIHSHILPLSETSLTSGGGQSIMRTNWGIDIGVGTSCIYPLLGAKQFHWNMVGTDIDMQALSIAQTNVAANPSISSKINLRHVSSSYATNQNAEPGGPFTQALESSRPISVTTKPPSTMPASFDFLMTNPPFYDSLVAPTEHADARAGDGRARAPMTPNEGSFPGGEVGFCVDLIADSIRFPSSCTWFSAMLGKKTSLIELHKNLVQVLGYAHVEIGEYGPGQYTRWFLAWTLRQPRMLAPSARLPMHQKDAFYVNVSLPSSSNSPGTDAMDEVAQRICAFCESSPGGWKLAATTVKSGFGVMVSIHEKDPTQPKIFADEDNSSISLPTRFVDLLQRQQTTLKLLPDEGHFLVQAKILLNGNIPTAPTNGGPQSVQVKVQLSCYRHSWRGTKAIEKIRGGMDAEVARTNRKWRRQLKRQVEGAPQNKQGDDQPAPMEADE